MQDQNLFLLQDQNLFLRDLPSLVLEKLKPRLRAQNLSSGQVLFAPGDKVSNIYFMRSGAVSLVCELADGQMIETAMIGHDSVVAGGAALDDRDAMYKAIVQIGGTGFALDVDTARHVAREHEEFRRAIIRHEQLILAQAQQSAACNATHTLNQRLARWLLHTRDVLGADNFLLTQEFMAEMLGVRRTSVSIVAHSIQEAGLISYRRGHIKIDKPEELQQATCECYGTIRMQYHKLLKAETLEAPGNPLDARQRYAAVGARSGPISGNRGQDPVGST
jgi:CRP-like cAMP-binding protein